MKFTNVAIASCIILARTAVGASVGGAAAASEATPYVPRLLPPLVLPNRKHLSKGQSHRARLVAGPLRIPTAAGRGVASIMSGVGPISPSLARPIMTVTSPTSFAHPRVLAEPGRNKASAEDDHNSACFPRGYALRCRLN